MDGYPWIAQSPPVSLGATVRIPSRSLVRADVEQALTIIDSLHGIAVAGYQRPLPVRVAYWDHLQHPRLNSHKGLYRMGKSITFNRWWSGSKLGTAVHELGHHVDYAGLGGGSSFLSENPSLELLAPWRQTVQESVFGGFWLEEAERARRGESSKYTQAQTIRDGSWRELFARGYEQWVALRSGEAALLAGIDEYLRATLREGEALYWPWDEFAAIADSYDQLFGDLGWLGPVQPVRLFGLRAPAAA